MTTDFISAIERELAGVHFFSVGACPGCESCGLGDVESMDDPAYDGASEGHFSWRACDSCGSGLGGDRFAAHGCIAESVEAARDAAIEHFDVCADCLMFHANGDEPERWGE